MKELNWIKGTPTEKGKYWLCLHDQGGWPFIVIGTVYTRLEYAGEIDKKIKLLIKDGKREEAKKYFEGLPLWISIPGLCEPHDLSGLWNCDAYAIFKDPELPEWLQVKKEK